MIKNNKLDYNVPAGNYKTCPGSSHGAQYLLYAIYYLPPTMYYLSVCSPPTAGQCSKAGPRPVGPRPARGAIAVLSYGMLRYVMLWNAMLCYAMLCYALLYTCYTVINHNILYCTVLY